MQREPLLLSSAKIGVPTEHSRLSWGGIVLVIFLGFFVVYGAVDICVRIFSSNASAEALFPVANENASLLMPLIPERLIIPALSVEAVVEPVGENGGGNMAVPKRFDEVAWYKLGSKPGAPGNAVIAGHLNNAIGLSGVFETLNTLPLGSDIIIEGEGRRIRYVVREMTVYEAGDAPAEDIFAHDGPSRLVLITCDGAWDAGVRSYDKRLVLIAEPVL